MKTEERRLKNPLPYYTVGIVWIFCGFIFPMYVFMNWVIATVLSVVVFIIARKKAPDKIIIVESKVEPTGNHLADSYIQQGRENIKTLYNIRLNDPNIEKDKEKLVDLASKIIDFIAKYPRKANQITNFIDYYLPTTISLLESYGYLLDQGQNSENIKTSKEKIKQIMPTMIVAFEKHLDSLFSDKALDIQAEFMLLQDLLKREGLQ